MWVLVQYSKVRYCHETARYILYSICYAFIRPVNVSMLILVVDHDLSHLLFPGHVQHCDAACSLHSSFWLTDYYLGYGKPMTTAI